MKLKKILITISLILLMAISAVLLVSCTRPTYDKFTLNGWEYIALNKMQKKDKELDITKVDITRLRVSDFIDLGGLKNETLLYQGGDKEVNAEGWYPTLIDNFDVTYNENRGLNPDIWATSRHDIRHETNKKFHPEYADVWCPQMVSVVNNQVVVKAAYDDNHTCEVCKSYGYTKARFTGGFETRDEVLIKDSNGKPVLDENGKRQYKSNILWGQAYGYFEASVKFPDADGMWSAFWLQGNEMREIGFDGTDGTEIDIYESAFRKDNKKVSRMGHALLWNGYGSSAKVEGHINKLEQNLYDGKFHTFSLLWTPQCYIFFIDGYATWATNGGGISRVPEFIRFTNEIDTGDGWGQHGQKIGQFKHDQENYFYIDYVKVYQNIKFESSIAPSKDGKPYSKENNYESHFVSPYDGVN